MKNKYFLIVLIIAITTTLLCACSTKLPPVPSDTQIKTTVLQDSPSPTNDDNMQTSQETFYVPSGTTNVSSLGDTPTLLTSSQNKTSPPAVSASPTNQTLGLVSREEMKKWLELETFEKMNQILNFQDEKRNGSFLEAESAKAPGILFVFLRFGDSEPFECMSLNATASIFFPEYINVPINQIPIFDDQEDELRIIMKDNYGTYIVALSVPGVLSADDDVNMLNY